MNHISHINAPSQPMQNQQLNHNLLLQRSPNSQGVPQQIDQLHHQQQIHSLQPQQNLQQMSQYPNHISQQQNLSSSTSSTSLPQSSRSNTSYQQISSSQQGNKSHQQQVQLPTQNEGYPHLHNLQNQQVLQIQNQNLINHSGTGLIMQGQLTQQHNQQQQSQQNYQINQNQQGMVYAHQANGSKQQQHQQSQKIQQQPFLKQQDSRRNSSRSDKNSQTMHSNGGIPNQQQPSLVLNNNLVGICSEKDSPLAILEQFVEPIYEDFVYLTEKILDKTMKSANKQLQDTLMNYFLENHVSNLIIKDMNCISKRAVRYEIEKTMQKNKTAKYMNLLNAFEQKVRQFGKDKAYEHLLMQLITDENSGSKQSEQWKTLVRKRILALLLYIHWQTPNSETIFNDFFAIWDLIYPNHPLPQKVKKSATVSQVSGSQISSQYAIQNGSHQQEKQQNPNKGMKRNKQKIIENMNLSQVSLSSQISNNNSQSTSLFQQNSNQTYSQRGSKVTDQKMKLSSNQSPEMRRKSDKEISHYSEANSFNQQSYNSNQGLNYPNQNQRQQMFVNQNQQQNFADGQVPNNSTYYLSQGGQQNGQYDYSQNINNFYGTSQSGQPQFDQNYQQAQQINLKPAGQVFKGRMRSQSWDDLGQKREDYQGNNNIQQQQGYYNQPQQPSQFYQQQQLNNQQTNQQYGYEQPTEYYDTNINSQYSNPPINQQSSSSFYIDFQNSGTQQQNQSQQQQQVVNRQTSQSLPQNANEQQSQITNTQHYGQYPNQQYQNQQYQANNNYNQNYGNQQQYQQTQKIPIYQNNIYDIQEVKQEGSPSSQNTQESNNNQFFHMDKIVLADPESPDQRLKRISQQTPQNNYTPVGNSRARYSLQYNQAQSNQQEAQPFQQNSQSQYQQQSHQLQPPQQPLSKQSSSQQQQQLQIQQQQSKNNQYQASQNPHQGGGIQGQYEQTGNKYQMSGINNTKQEEDLYSSSSHFSGSNQQQLQRPNQGNKNKNGNCEKQYQDSPLGIKNRNGAYIDNTKQEETDSITQPQTSDNNDVSHPDEIDQVEFKGDKKRNTLQNVLQIQQLQNKSKDKRLSSPSIINSPQINDNTGGKLQQIKLQQTNQLPINELNENNSPSKEEKLDDLYQQGQANTQSQFYPNQTNQNEIQRKNKNKQNLPQINEHVTDNNQNANTYSSQSKEISPTNNGLFQEYQNNEDQFLNIPNQANRNNNMIANEDKFIRNSQRQNTGMSIMSIESEKTPFKRSDTRNMTGLSNISIESDKDGRTPSHINRSKFFFRHQNSLEFPPIAGMRTNVRQGTAISNISDGLGAMDFIGNSQTNINQFFTKRSNFKQFSGLSQISLEGNELNYLQYMQASNQSQNFGNISRSQLRKRTNLSVDSLARFNIKPDSDIQNLSFDLDNLSIQNQQLQVDFNGQILPQNTINEVNNLEDSKNNPEFQQYNFSPPNNEILP